MDDIPKITMPVTEMGNDSADNLDNRNWVERTKESVKALNKPEIEITDIPMDWLQVEPEPMQFALYPYFPKQAVTLWIGAGGVGKSYTALYMACCYATEKDFLGCEAKGNKVAYLSLEDPERAVRNRIYSLAKNFDHQKLTENFKYIDRYGLETHLVESASGDIRVSDMADEIIKAFGDDKPDMLIVDTLIRTHSVNENANAEMGVVINAYERLARVLDCAVVVLHHVPKAAVGEKTRSGDSHVARGASAITDNARSSIILEPETKVFTDIDPEDITRQRLVKLMHRKHNYSDMHPDSWLLLKSGGVQEFVPKIDTRPPNEIRYEEIYNWWKEDFGRNPVCWNNIRTAITSIRPGGTTHGRPAYEEAWQWAEAQGKLTKQTVENATPNARYFALTSPSKLPTGWQGDEKC